jgi:hypothetical protein
MSESDDQAKLKQLGQIVKLLHVMSDAGTQLAKQKKESNERLGSARVRLKGYIESSKEQASPQDALDLIVTSWQEVTEAEDGYKTLVGAWRDTLKDLQARLRKLLDDSKQLTLSFDGPDDADAGEEKDEAA